MRVFKAQFKEFLMKSQVANVEYAASISPRIVDFFEDYFQIEYPLPKLGTKN